MIRLRGSFQSSIKAKTQEDFDDSFLSSSNNLSQIALQNFKNFTLPPVLLQKPSPSNPSDSNQELKTRVTTTSNNNDNLLFSY
jgi:hypothetical protein